MQTWKSGVVLVVTSLAIGAVRLMALGDESHRGANNGHPIMVAQQDGSANRSTQTEDARLWKTMAAATSAGMERIRQRAIELEAFDAAMDDHEGK